jgi:hypothetical protein
MARYLECLLVRKVPDLKAIGTSSAPSGAGLKLGCAD